jgi:RNA polymerase sigma factor (sigma-70 family)
MEPSDEALVYACRRGDSAAWEAISARYRQLVYTVCRRAGLDREQAADACQIVFTILASKLDSLEQPARLHAWLVTTARRQAVALRNRERVAGTTSFDDLTVDVQAPDLPPDEWLERIEDQLKVRAALSSLDPRCRELLSLLFYRPAPAPYSEITAVLGIPEGSIGPIRGRCLQRLRRKLDELGFRR